MQSRTGTPWDDLEAPFKECLEQAWTSLAAKGLPVGACVTFDGDVVSSGRNRVYDPPGGIDALQGTPIAHAEMNAFAALPEGIDASDCELFSTQQPCHMCAGTAEFLEITSIRFLASDPSDRIGAAPWIGDTAGTAWMVLANTLFIHNVAWVAGQDAATVVRNRIAEPEVTEYALAKLQSRVLIEAAEDRMGLGDLAGLLWGEVTMIDERRSTRLTRLTGM